MSIILFPETKSTICLICLDQTFLQNPTKNKLGIKGETRAVPKHAHITVYHSL